MRSLIVVASLVVLNGCAVDRVGGGKRAFTEGYYVVDNARESKAYIPLAIVRFNSTNTPLNLIYVQREGENNYSASHASSSKEFETDLSFPREAIRRGPRSWWLSQLYLYPDRYELRSYSAASDRDDAAPAFDPDRVTAVEKYQWRPIEKKEAVVLFRSYLDTKEVELRKFIPCAAAFEVTCEALFRD